MKYIQQGRQVKHVKVRLSCLSFGTNTQTRFHAILLEEACHDQYCPDPTPRQTRIVGEKRVVIEAKASSSAVFLIRIIILTAAAVQFDGSLRLFNGRLRNRGSSGIVQVGRIGQRCRCGVMFQPDGNGSSLVPRSSQ